ncbi:MAG: TerC family protein [Candidatus Zixiibacteriota bacterium]
MIPPAVFGSVEGPVFWIGFIVLVLLLLALDLFWFHRRPHAIAPKEALKWVCFWVGLAVLFNLFVYFKLGTQSALEFATGYLVEEALSLDNVFVIVVIFRYFQVPPQYQHRTLFFGILGAIVLRGVFIITGAALLARFHWIIYVFGAFLLFTGIKLAVQEESGVHPEHNPVLRWLRRVMPITRDYQAQRFFVRRPEGLAATPLFAVLVMVEAMDVVFALDSIPAIFGVTRDPFIVLTSNVFAILGLRSLFFLLAGIIDKFHYLKYGLGLVLAFIGVKMLISWRIEIPIAVSLGIVALLLGGSIALSFLRPALPDGLPREKRRLRRRRNTKTEPRA